MASNGRKHSRKKISHHSIPLRKIRKNSIDRGNNSERLVLQALESLRDEFNVPIKVTLMPKGSLNDRRGVDIRINGMRVNGKDKLNANFGIDVKSSQGYVDKYLEKQAQLKLKGIRNPYPRYPFLFNYQMQSALLVELLLLILEKSVSHTEWVDRILSDYQPEGEGFNQKFRLLISDIFDL